LHKRGPNTWIRNERVDETLEHSIQTLLLVELLYFAEKLLKNTVYIIAFRGA